MPCVSPIDKLKFIILVILCGTGMFVIPYHIAYVGKEFAIANRMMLAGISICVYAFYKGFPFPTLTGKTIKAFIVSGVCLYSLNYLLIYEAVMGLPSGICSLIIAAIIVPNSFFGTLILKTKINKCTMIGASIALFGLLTLFPGDILEFDPDKVTTYSFLLMFVSLFVSSFGTVITSKFMREGYDFYWMTGIAMLVGGSITMTNGFWTHDAFPWSWDLMHLATWFYMSIPCTAVIFVIYMRIVNKFGAGNASYVWILSPTIALSLSHLFEDMDWTLERMFGTCIILLGSMVAIYKPRTTMHIKPTTP